MKENSIQGVLAVAMVAVSVLGSFFVYQDGAGNQNYNRTQATHYAIQYALEPNPAYYNFDGVGGDCTSFVSQALRAGGMHMTAPKANPTNKDWYYYGSSWGKGRSSSWTNAHSFFTYWSGAGVAGIPKAYAQLKFTPPDFAYSQTWLTIWQYLEPGDIVQYVSEEGLTYHTQMVCSLGYEKGDFTAAAAQHSENGFRDLRNYAVILPLKTTIYITKIRAPAVEDRKYYNSIGENVDLTELSEWLEREGMRKTATREEEVEKWERVAALKRRLVELEGERFTGISQLVTRETFEGWLSDRYAGNLEQIATATTQAIAGARNTATLKRTEIENTEIAGILQKLHAGVPFDELWTYYWEHVVHQKPPTYFVIT